MGEHQELIVITKTYDLIMWSCNHTSRFPRNHRFVLGERIERRLYDLLEILLQAKYTRNRQPLLQEANLGLEILRFQMRLAKDLQCLKTNSYALAAKAIDEIGKLIGGWLKSEHNRWHGSPKNRASHRTDECQAEPAVHCVYGLAGWAAGPDSPPSRRVG